MVGLQADRLEQLDHPLLHRLARRGELVDLQRLADDRARP
jgi:hypothetical protein